MQHIPTVVSPHFHLLHGFGYPFIRACVVCSHHKGPKYDMLRMCPPRAGRSAFFPTCHEGPEKVHKYDVVCYCINMTLEERGAGVDSTGVPVIPVKVVAAPDQEDLAYAEVACLPVFLSLPIT